MKSKKSVFLSIDKRIPIPSIKENRVKKYSPKVTHYPFGWMEVGDSFFTESLQVGVSCKQFSQRHPSFKFTQRKVEGGIRVWRIK